jgi:hypothetical protein
VTNVNKGIGVILMTNSDNGEKIFKAVLEQTIGDTCTPGSGSDSCRIT